MWLSDSHFDWIPHGPCRIGQYREDVHCKETPHFIFCTKFNKCDQKWTATEPSFVGCPIGNDKKSMVSFLECSEFKVRNSRLGMFSSASKNCEKWDFQIHFDSFWRSNNWWLFEKITHRINFALVDPKRPQGAPNLSILDELDIGRMCQINLGTVN